MNYWREKAAQTIQDAIAFTSKDMDLNNLSEAQKRELRCAIDAAYPFGIRRNHPYQMWLDERRKTFYRLGLHSSNGTKKPPIGCDSTDPGQLSLF